MMLTLADRRPALLTEVHAALYKDASTALAADWTDVETFSRPPRHAPMPTSVRAPDWTAGSGTDCVPVSCTQEAGRCRDALATFGRWLARMTTMSSG
jgi:hypothetical protein